MDDYKDFLDVLAKPAYARPMIKSYTMQHKDDTVQFIIKVSKEQMSKLEARSGFIKKLKLEKSFTISNIHLFDAEGKLKHYSSPLQVIEDFFTVRKTFYEKRKQFLTAKLTKEVNRLSNLAKFCSMIAKGDLKVGNRSKADLVKELEKHKFQKDTKSDGFDYLLNQPIYSLTSERLQKLEKEKITRSQELKDLLKTNAFDMWKQELNDLRKELLKELKHVEQKRPVILHEEKKPAPKVITPPVENGSDLD